MNKCQILILTICVSFIFSNTFGQQITVIPEKPRSGEEITVKFDPAGTKLANSNNIKVYAYLYQKDLSDTRSVDMTKKDNMWIADIESDDDDLGMLLLFKDEDLVENNNKRGYLVNFYDDNEKLLPGTLAGAAYAYYSWGSYYMDLDPNPEFANELITKEFTANPGLKKDYVQYYVPIEAGVNKDKAPQIMKEAAGYLASKENLNESEYTLITDLYRKMNDTSNASKYEKIAAEKYPSGEMIQMKEYTRISSLPDIDSKIAASKEFAGKFENSDYLAGIHNSIIKNLIQSKEFEKLHSFFKENQDEMIPYFFQDASLKILKAEGNAETALSIALMGVERNDAVRETEEKPAYLSESDWKQSQVEMDGQMLFAQGRALYELNKKQEAAEVLQQAAEKTDFKSSDINLYYAKSLADVNEHKKVFELVSGFITQGTATPEMRPILKDSYIKTKGTEEGYDSYLAQLEKKSNEKLAVKLRGEMFNETAPLFKLTDLEGKEVSLEGLKGKVVILDFWATWCGPCLASFPGMKKAVEMHSNDKDVVFLFVNTSERVADKKQNALDFINKNKYPFHVILDLENSVRISYKVPGIPTKFVIDKNGNIRFKKVGYEGNDDQMVNEIATMISLVK